MDYNNSPSLAPVEA